MSPGFRSPVGFRRYFRWSADNTILLGKNTTFYFVFEPFIDPWMFLIIVVGWMDGWVLVGQWVLVASGLQWKKTLRMTNDGSAYIELSSICHHKYANRGVCTFSRGSAYSMAGLGPFRGLYRSPFTIICRGHHRLRCCTSAIGLVAAYLCPFIYRRPP